MKKIDTIALDLEGTLISNAVSQFPRPGLFEFLEFCRNNFSRVVVYTAVREELSRRIMRLLVSEGVAPAWFADIPYVDWDLNFKDLRNIPGADPENCLIVDDNRDYIMDEQYDQWIEIAKFESPYSQEDRELDQIRGSILDRI